MIWERDNHQLFPVEETKSLELKLLKADLVEIFLRFSPPFLKYLRLEYYSPFFLGVYWVCEGALATQP